MTALEYTMFTYILISLILVLFVNNIYFSLSFHMKNQFIVILFQQFILLNGLIAVIIFCLYLWFSVFSFL